LNRAAALKLDAAGQARLQRLSRDVDAKAAAGAAQFLSRLRDGQGRDWIDEFLTYRDDFEFWPAAGEVMQAFSALRAKHDGAAKKLLDESRAAFQQGRPDEGYAKYQQIVENYYAASSYRNAKRWIAERK
jgi:hypothetical protein